MATDDKAQPVHAGSDQKAGQVSDNTNNAGIKAAAADLLDKKPDPKPEAPNTMVTSADGKNRVDAVPQAGTTVGDYMASAGDSYKPLSAGRATDGKLANGKPDAMSPESKAAPGETPKASEVGRPSETQKPGDAVKDGSDKGAPPTKDQAIQGFADQLARTGMSPTEARTHAEQTYQRLSEVSKGKEGQDSGDRLKGGPEEQMKRASDAMGSVLDFRGNKLTDGQPNYLSMADRQSMVKDMAARLEDPNKFANQGHHNTCGLESMQKQHLQGGDPAKVLENMASVVNTGAATVTDAKGNQRTVHVDSRSLAPDGESGQSFDPRVHGDGGQRGVGGQAFDALAGQLNADLKAERNNLPTSANGIDKAGLVYMAAHADTMGAKNGQSDTNEGLFQRTKDGPTMLENSPSLGVWDAALVNRTMGGKDGAVFVNSNFDGVNGGVPPKGFPPDLKLSTFSSAQELHDKVAAFEDKTGQSGQLVVNAAFLPGGGMKGHSGHAMNVTAAENGKFNLDNNWGTKFDLGKVDASAVDRATNPAAWGDKPGQAPGQTPGGDRVVPGGDRTVPGGDRTIPGSGGAGQIPHDGGTPLKPGDGRMPNETDDQFKTRLEFDKLKKDPNTNLDALTKYAKALADWQAQEATARALGKPWDAPKPDFAQFNSTGN